MWPLLPNLKCRTFNGATLVCFKTAAYIGFARETCGAKMLENVCSNTPNGFVLSVDVRVVLVLE